MVFHVKKQGYFLVLVISALLLLNVFTPVSGLSPLQTYTPKKIGKLGLIILVDGLDYRIFQEVNTPNLDQLASSGYLFQSHSVLPSSTTVGVTAIATGTYPNASNIVHTYAYNAEEYHSLLPDEEPIRYYYDQMLNATTIFETLFDRGVHTYLITAKSKLEVMLGLSGSVESFTYMDWEDYLPIEPHQPTLGLEDRKVMIEAMTNKTLENLGRAIQYIEGGEDVFMFLAYPEPDWSGHALGPNSTVYKGIIEYIDGQVGRIINFIKQEGLWDNSLIIVVADHGYTLIDPSMNVLDPNDLNHIPSLGIPHTVSPTGGTSLYLYLKNLSDLQEAVNQLWSYPWVAGIWTRIKVNNTNGTLKDVGLNSPYAGDIFIDIKPPYYASAYVNRGAHGGFDARQIPIIVSGGSILTDATIDSFTQLHVAPTLAKLFDASLPSKSVYISSPVEFKPSAFVEAKVSPRIAEPDKKIEIEANYSIGEGVQGATMIIDVVDQNRTLVLHNEISLELNEGVVSTEISISKEGIMTIYLYIVDANGRVLGGTRLQLLVTQIEKPPRNWSAILGGVILSIVLIALMFFPFYYKRIFKSVRKE